MYNILICDDERDIVNALKIYLSGEDYRVFEAANGLEALEIVRREEIHLILMDVMMPQLDGIAATVKLRETSNAPVLMLTAKRESGDKILGLNVGADDYITKPFDPAEVLARDESAVARTAERYGAQLRALAYGILEDISGAEECENDAYLAAWESIPPHEPRTYLFAYLARITRHLSLDRCRARGREKRGARVEELTAELAECVPARETATERLEARELADAISAFLHTLPEEKSELFLRRYWYCDSVTALAERMGWGESRVKTTLHRLRNALRAYLQKEGYLQ